MILRQFRIFICFSFCHVLFLSFILDNALKKHVNYSVRRGFFLAWHVLNRNHRWLAAEFSLGGVNKPTTQSMVMQTTLWMLKAMPQKTSAHRVHIVGIFFLLRQLFPTPETDFWTQILNIRLPSLLSQASFPWYSLGRRKRAKETSNLWMKPVIPWVHTSLYEFDRVYTKHKELPSITTMTAGKRSFAGFWLSSETKITGTDVVKHAIFV